MSKSSSGRLLRLPVRFVDGVWEYALGGPVPVTPGTEAILMVSRHAINDKTFLGMHTQKSVHRILPEGTSLLVCLTVAANTPLEERFARVLQRYDSYKEQIATQHLPSWNPATLGLVEVTLSKPEKAQRNLFPDSEGGMWLQTEGAEPVRLITSSILLPKEITDQPMASLNHAYTKLSEVFETRRISHTGNIYANVLYQERNRKWYPLDVLRNRTLYTQEQEIARELWESFLTKMRVTEKG